MAEEMDFSTFYKDKVSPLIVKIILEILFYGVYFTLFCVCMGLHRQQCYISRRPLQRAGLIVLFFLATSATILDTTATMKQIWLYLGQYWGGQSSLDAETASSMTVRLDIICGTVTFGLYVISNFIADLILIHRNSVLWNGSRWKMMIWVPLIISITNNVLGIIGIGLEASNISVYPSLSVSFDQYTNGDKIVLAYLFTNACLNLLLTGCLAGRVWWMGKTAASALGTHPLRQKYHSAVAITFESGILYPVALIGSVAATLQNSTAPSLYPFLIQIAAIAPTLIVVRTVLGISIEQRDLGSYEEVSSDTILSTFAHSGDAMPAIHLANPSKVSPTSDLISYNSLPNPTPILHSADVVTPGKGTRLTFSPY
ncbi:hypothetical protein F5879DRAFT_190630 [Lentinula edodes]|uniref:uncharacterized protein n=1 Tax=Lentinula edodes TaxID=5353 RepID=UPI001E8DF0F0|nr:uncharacterized protein C8R40DRAFT_1118544 [Lentinula edodes]KAH7872140.1 hypothetical protein C8R40DRAFT_1118544 [Lentinula edodes]KAJ3902957.1 hypothetical protein F5879DRAFT_190630 [Lentinula edodes]